MTRIQLRTNPEILREVYFPNGEDNVFFGKTTRKHTILLICALVIYPLLLFLDFSQNREIVLISGIFSMLYFIYNFWHQVIPVYRRNKEIINYIDNSEKIRNLEIRFDDLVFIHEQDHRIIKVNWDSIAHAIITPILLQMNTANDSFLIPKKSILESEFEMLSSIVLDRVIQVTKY